MKVNNNILVCFKGFVSDPTLGLAPYSAYAEADKQQKANEATKDKPTRLAPEFKGVPSFEPVLVEVNGGETKTEAVRKKYVELQAAGKLCYGPFGDYISTTELDDKHILINQIAHKAFPKIAKATDMILIIKGVNERGEEVDYLVAIRRKNEPGKGQPATIGGFNNVDQDNGIDVVDSDIYTVIKEGKEEGDTHITLDNLKAIREDYNCKEAAGHIRLGKDGRTVPCLISDAGTFKTGDDLISKGGELIEGNSGGAKRVHLAAAITVTVDVPKDITLTRDRVNSWFKAGTDASDLLVYDVTQEVKASTSFDAAGPVAQHFFVSNKMGINHHVKIIQAGFSKAHEVFHRTHTQAKASSSAVLQESIV